MIYTGNPYKLPPAVSALRFEWNDEKAQTNVDKHDVSFDVAIAVFTDPQRVDYDVSRPEDQEERRKAVGSIQDRLFTVVYTLRGDVRRLISARRSNPKEEKSYGDRPSDP